MQRLTGIDAAFLALETPSAHMQVLGVAIVDPSTVPSNQKSASPKSASPKSAGAKAAGAKSANAQSPGSYFDRVHELLEARLHLVQPLRRRLVEVPFGVHIPIWIEDPNFDLDYHLRRAALPAPGGARELTAFVADVAGRPLDRRHPLWEAYVVEGLEHGYQAFVTKVHHSLIDGAAGVEMIAALFDLEAGAPLRPVQPAQEWHADSVPGDLEMLAHAVVSIAQSPAKVVRAVTNLVPGAVRFARRARHEALDVALPLTAPRLSMNRTITPHRAVAFSSVSLDEVKAVKNALGVTVNDVVLTVTAGALRIYLSGRDELPDRPLVASIPTSVRTEGDDRFGNRVSSMFAGLPVEIDDPIERVRAVASSMTGAKVMHEDMGGTTLEDWAEVAAPALFSRAMRAYTRLRVGERLRPVINLIMSNVPGPPWPLYLAGAHLVALHPLGPIFDDCGLNVTVISYLDHVDFGFLASRELLPDVDDLAAAVPEAFAELVKAASVVTA
ncbi:MAG: diacylglycerol O-acyltransferase / wax synthase [Actinomycetota bacterium]|jgi:diacylglycerol O-acyltransferase|nr:diacylglycerol O-acyltransferase / wax synthase [Actinomycetota bacterium]